MTVGWSSIKNKRMARVVLDASAVLAVLHGETGADLVTNVLDDAVLSTVNYSEVLGKLIERGGTTAQARAAFASLDIQIIAFDTDLAERVAELKKPTRSAGLSLADRVCLALAGRERAPAVTADRRWSALTLGIEIKLIR